MNDNRHLPLLQKTVSDVKSCVEDLRTTYFETTVPINDDVECLQRFFGKLEYLLQFSLRVKASPIGKNKDYWDYFRHCLSSNRQLRDGLKYVKSLKEINTSLGRGRAFIRFSLVHCRLAETLHQCLCNANVTRDWYFPNALWHNWPLRRTLVEALYDLNELKFDLPPYGHDLDNAWPTFSRTAPDPNALASAWVSGNEKWQRSGSISTTDLDTSSQIPDSECSDLAAENSLLSASVSFPRISTPISTKEHDTQTDDHWLLALTSLPLPDVQSFLSSFTECLSKLEQSRIDDSKMEIDRICCLDSRLSQVIERQSDLSSDLSQALRLRNLLSNCSDVEKLVSDLESLDILLKAQETRPENSGLDTSDNSVNTSIDQAKHDHQLKSGLCNFLVVVANLAQILVHPTAAANVSESEDFQSLFLLRINSFFSLFSTAVMDHMPELLLADSADDDSKRFEDHLEKMWADLLKAARDIVRQDYAEHSADCAVQTGLSIIDLNQLETKNADLQQKVTELEALLVDNQKQTEKLKEEFKNEERLLRRNLQTVEDELASLRFQVSTQALTCETCKNVDVNLLLTKTEDLEHLLDTLNLQMYSLETERESERGHWNSKTSEFNRAMFDRDEIIRRLNADMKTVREKLSHDRAKNRTLQEELTAFQSEFAQQHNFRDEVEALRGDNKLLKRKLLKLVREKDSLWQRTDSLQYRERLKASEKWLSDNEAQNCMNCHSQFTLLLRRHHCRLCGRIFCYNCCNHWVLTTLSSKKCRVCDDCFIGHKDPARNSVESVLRTEEFSPVNDSDDDFINAPNPTETPNSHDDISSSAIGDGAFSPSNRLTSSVPYPARGLIETESCDSLKREPIKSGLKHHRSMSEAGIATRVRFVEPIENGGSLRREYIISDFHDAVDISSAD